MIQNMKILPHDHNSGNKNAGIHSFDDRLSFTFLDRCNSCWRGIWVLNRSNDTATVASSTSSSTVASTESSTVESSTKSVNHLLPAVVRHRHHHLLPHLKAVSLKSQRTVKQKETTPRTIRKCRPRNDESRCSESGRNQPRNRAIYDCSSW